MNGTTRVEVSQATKIIIGGDEAKVRVIIIASKKYIYKLPS